ncbi:RsiV family protein [Virgibacillus halophilus]|uniref:RsiV family protein n=1 Tax=Tigheibacillus halophilus TaxID=361280 RepID=A0ABU5CA45_9BACI|nr:RsiV family protein [Virgibacillus halophilus]
MDRKLKQLKDAYERIPIPDELDEVIEKALRQNGSRHKRSYPYKWIFGSVAAIFLLFAATLNASSALAESLAKVPVLGPIVKVVTIREIKEDRGNYHADINTPHLEGLHDKKLSQSLNEKYMQESRELYEQFKEETDGKSLKGHMAVDSGFKVKTDDATLLSIERYVERTQASSETKLYYDTIDKKNGLLLKLPMLFKNHDYVQVISQNIKTQMQEQMDNDPNKIYWLPGYDKETDEELTSDEMFQQIDANQTFYINKQHKLVIVFNDYDVAPGYMGTVAFVIPTKTIADLLVGNGYIR